MTAPSNNLTAQWKHLRPMLVLCSGLDFLIALWPVARWHEPLRDWRSLAGGSVTGLLALLLHLKIRAGEKGAA